jgi:hypothetical protein
MSRNISDLTEETRIAYFRFKEGMDKAAIDYILTCTLRTAEEQLELWKKGRAIENGKWVVVDRKKCVTWTLNSKHLEGTAFDIAIMVAGKLLWDARLDVDGDGIPEYTEAGKIGQSVGLKWGGDFGDPPHFQLGG